MFEKITQADLANNARKAAYDGGSLRLYSGARPANVAAGVSGTLLAQLALSATAFPVSSNRVLTANAITATTGITNGTAGYAACFASDGTTLLSLHSLGTSAAEVIVNTTAITTGIAVSCSSFTISQPDGS